MRCRSKDAGTGLGLLTGAKHAIETWIYIWPKLGSGLLAWSVSASRGAGRTG